ncbi:hypothetical protein [Streptomyces glaucescens]|uniref:Putative secreted protein n=1 Tax=Streptomyces glaucescens TaxID=1907 RepID=A0A089XBH7_STRGA|nr:hypothetical protein [Streptomyces glaucescens]AIR98484.1 putative secreted protein [Streptomyces glaucescens]
MLTLQKFVTVSGLVGSLAAVCVGAGHAYAGEKPGECRTTEQGGTVCVRKSETHVEKDGTYTIRQSQSCTVADRPRVVLPEERLMEGGSARIGERIDCSNRAELPEGFRKPSIKR